MKAPGPLCAGIIFVSFAYLASGKQICQALCRALERKHDWHKLCSQDRMAWGIWYKRKYWSKMIWSYNPQSWSPLVVIWNPFLSHVIIQSRNGLLLLHKIREDDASKQHFFFFQTAHEAPTYQAFSPFQFVSNAKGCHWAFWHRFM